MKMPRPFLIFSQSDYLIQVADTNSNTEWQTMQIQIWIYTVCKGRVYPGSVGLGLIEADWWGTCSGYSCFGEEIRKYQYFLIGKKSYLALCPLSVHSVERQWRHWSVCEWRIKSTIFSQSVNAQPRTWSESDSLVIFCLNYSLFISMAQNWITS